MTSIKITCKAAKKIDIVSWLQSAGIYPVKVQGNDHWYLSPLRQEHTASFKVNRQLNAWYDHGAGRGGNLVDLGILLHQCSVKALLEKLSAESFSFHQQPTIVAKDEQEITSKLTLVAAAPLTSNILCNYMMARGIDVDIAKAYCEQITYTNQGKNYNAIGFKNNAGGYELRAANFKSTIAPKHYSFFAVKGQQTVAVFEGFTDFLSILSTSKKLLPEPTNYLVLNSLGFFEKARAVMKAHQEIYLLLDNDTAGKNCVQKAMALSEKYKDLSSHYLPHKDLNEWLMKS